MKLRHRAFLMVALLNCLVFGAFYFLFPVILRTTQPIPSLGKALILLVGLLAWPLASIIDVGKTSLPAFIPFHLLFESSFKERWPSPYDHSLGRCGFVGIQVVSLCAIVTMLAHFLGGVSGIVFFCISVGGTVSLSLAAVFLLRTIEKVLYLDAGHAIDHSHRATWSYGREHSEGVATKRQVYEHYHGQFSWSKRHAGLLAVLRFVTFAVSTALPLVLLMSNTDWGIISPSKTTTWFALAVTVVISFVIHYLVPSFG